MSLEEELIDIANYRRDNSKLPSETSDSLSGASSYKFTKETETTTESSLWTEQHERILREWKVEAFINMWLQSVSSYYYSKIHDLLSYPVIIFSSLSSAALLSTTNHLLKYFVGSISLLTGVLTVITRQLRPGELFQNYSHTSRRYQVLIRTIDTCLDIPKELRCNPETFIDKIKNEIDSLGSVQLYPPIHVVKIFENKFGNIDEKMYGEDIVELLKNDIKNRRMVNKMIKNQNSFSVL